MLKFHILSFNFVFWMGVVGGGAGQYLWAGHKHTDRSALTLVHKQFLCATLAHMTVATM
jgi:hypothetical protein